MVKVLIPENLGKILSKCSNDRCVEHFFTNYSENIRIENYDFNNQENLSNFKKIGIYAFALQKNNLEPKEGFYKISISWRL